MIASVAYEILAAPFATVEAHEEATQRTLLRATENERCLMASLPSVHTARYIRALARDQAAKAGYLPALRAKRDALQKMCDNLRDLCGPGLSVSLEWAIKSLGEILDDIHAAEKARVASA